MPLTPAEVHNVAFGKPPIGKRGYDGEEVDAFLDLVEEELVGLIEQNNDLRARRGGGGGVGPQSHGGASVAALTAAREANSRLQARIAELDEALRQGKDGTAQRLAHVQQQLLQSERQVVQLRQQLQRALLAAQQAQARAGGGSAEEHAAQAVQVLALGQQTADLHLAQSKAEAERLVAEAQANAQATITNAQTQADKYLSDAAASAERLERDANAKSTQTIQAAEQRANTIIRLDQRKSELERSVEELRTIEREYRTRVKSCIESQLRDVDAGRRAEPTTAQEEERATGRPFAGSYGWS